MTARRDVVVSNRSRRPCNCACIPRSLPEESRQRAVLFEPAEQRRRINAADTRGLRHAVRISSGHYALDATRAVVWITVGKPKATIFLR